MSKEIAVFQKQVNVLVEKAEGLVIKSQKDVETAVTVLSEMNKIVDRITEEKEKVTKPLNEALKAERARWKPIEEMYADPIANLRKKMSDYQTEQVRLAREEEAKIAARVGEGRGKLKIETAERKMEEIDRPQDKTATASGMVKYRTDKRLKVTDIKKIPADFFTLDESKLLSTLKAGRVVPGAEIEEVQVPVNMR